MSNLECPITRADYNRYEWRWRYCRYSVSFGVEEMNNQIEPSDIIVLEWSFSPPDYFEDSIRVVRDDYEMIIENGRVEVKIHPNVFENNPTMKDDLTNSLNDRFLGVQLLTHEPYKSDPTVAAILNSYKMAVNEPNNELVHLYEIRDALSKKFGGESAARHALNINSQQWSRLGLLANREPLKQGLHRGKHPGALRDATESELMEARHIARAFVEAYILYLARSNTRNKKTEC